MIGDDVLFASVRELGAHLRARRVSAVELPRPAAPAGDDRPEARRGGDGDPRARARPGPPREPGAAGREGPRPAARDPVRGEGPPRHEGHPHHVGRRAAARPGVRLRRHGRRGGCEEAGAVLVRQARHGRARGRPRATTTPTRASPAPGARPGTPTTGAGARRAARRRRSRPGLVPFAIGSETSGSILTPAAFCGVTGLRPTYGLVSRHGAMALCWTLDKLGPIARSADDCGARARRHRRRRPRGPDHRRELPLPGARDEARRPGAALPRRRPARRDRGRATRT